MQLILYRIISSISPRKMQLMSRNFLRNIPPQVLDDQSNVRDTYLMMQRGRCSGHVIGAGARGRSVAQQLQMRCAERRQWRRQMLLLMWHTQWRRQRRHWRRHEQMAGRRLRPVGRLMAPGCCGRCGLQHLGGGANVGGCRIGGPNERILERVWIGDIEFIYTFSCPFVG